MTTKQDLQIILSSIIFLASIGISNAYGQDSTQTTAQSLLEAELSFHSKVSSTLLCEEGQYFSSCFEQASLCQERMQVQSAYCLKKTRAPQSFNKKLKTDQITKVQLQIKILSCMGQEFEKSFQSEKKSTLECNDPLHQRSFR